jgi:hypothetical protein
VYFEQNGNDSQGHRVGMQDVLVQLCARGQQVVEHAVETYSNGDFEFILDDIDLLDTNEWYVRVIPLDGYEVSTRHVVKNSNDERKPLDEEAGLSQPFHVILGNTYTVDTGVISLCDSSVRDISFAGVLDVSSKDAGSVRVVWEAATLEYCDNQDSASIMCHDDLILYDVFVANGPYSNFSSYSISELVYGAEKSCGVLHLETHELDIRVDNLKPGETYSVLVVARVPGIHCMQHALQDVVVSGRNNTESFI